jgi:hypothetical protein
VNTTNVVLKATVMPEWRKIFEAEDSDLPDLGAMEVCSSTEMGAPGASHLGTGGHGPKTDRSRPRSVPVNALGSRSANGRISREQTSERIVAVWGVVLICGYRSNSTGACPSGSNLPKMRLFRHYGGCLDN